MVVCFVFSVWQDHLWGACVSRHWCLGHVCLSGMEMIQHLWVLLSWVSLSVCLPLSVAHPCGSGLMPNLVVISGINSATFESQFDPTPESLRLVLSRPCFSARSLLFSQIPGVQGWCGTLIVLPLQILLFVQSCHASPSPLCPVVAKRLGALCFCPALDCAMPLLLLWNQRGR